MKKTFLAVLCSCIFSITSLKAQTDKIGDVYFDTGKYELRGKSKETLDSLAGNVELTDGQSIFLYGHTDSRGSIEYNQQLSYDRCTSVREYLEKKGIENIIQSQYGEVNPKYSNDTKEGMQGNRRVSIFIITDSIVAFKDSTDIALQAETDWTPLEEAFKRPDQTYNITGDKDTLIVTPDGTEVFIKAGTYKKRSTGKVDIIVRDVYNKSDFIRENLSTETTDGKVLESGGMVYVEARQNGRKLRINKGMQLEFNFKNQENTIDNYNESYTGIVDKRTGATIWKRVPTQLTRLVAKAPFQFNLFSWPSKQVNADFDDKKLRKLSLEEKIKHYLDKNYKLKKIKIPFLFNDPFGGWTNCDKNTRVDGSIKISVDSDELKTKVYYVFKNFKTVLAGKFKDKLFRLRPVLPGVDITVVCIRTPRPGEFECYIKNIISDEKRKDVVIEPMYVSKTPQEINELLNQFDIKE